MFSSLGFHFHCHARFFAFFFFFFFSFAHAISLYAFSCFVCRFTISSISFWRAGCASDGARCHWCFYLPMPDAPLPPPPCRYWFYAPLRAAVCPPLLYFRRWWAARHYAMFDFIISFSCHFFIVSFSFLHAEFHYFSFREASHSSFFFFLLLLFFFLFRIVSLSLRLQRFLRFVIFDIFFAISSLFFFFHAFILKVFAISWLSCHISFR